MLALYNPYLATISEKPSQSCQIRAMSQSWELLLTVSFEYFRVGESSKSFCL